MNEETEALEDYGFAQRHNPQPKSANLRLETCSLHPPHD